MRDTVSYIYIYTRTPQIEYSRHKKLRVFCIFEFADVAVSYIYIREIQIEYSLEIIFGPGIFYLWISRIYIYMRNGDQSNSKTQKTLHVLFMNYSIISLFIWY